MENLSKELLGLAGEYAAASELLKRGFYGQLTFGNHKRTDILVESETKMLRISVKSKQKKEWPGINGPFRADDFLIFVDYHKKNLTELPDFYIINGEIWNDIVAAEKSKIRTGNSKIVDTKDGYVTWSDGYKGLNIRVEHINDYKDNWSVLDNYIRKEETIQLSNVEPN